MRLYMLGQPSGAFQSVLNRPGPGKLNNHQSSIRINAGDIDFTLRRHDVDEAKAIFRRAILEFGNAKDLSSFETMAFSLSQAVRSVRFTVQQTPPVEINDHG